MNKVVRYEYNLCVEICNQVAEGMNVVQVLESNKERYPVWSTFRNWKHEHVELQTLYTRSIQDKAEMVDYEIDQIMTDMKSGLIEYNVARVLIDTLKWKAAKYYPKMFGDKVTVAGDKENPLIPQLDMSKLSVELLEQIAGAYQLKESNE
jgi:hypothetical protein